MVKKSERVFLVMAAVFFVGAAVTVLFGLLDVSVWLALVGAMYVFMAHVSRTSYRDGWLRGRWSMVEAIGEAQRRGLSLVEWLRAEAERDGLRIDITRVDPNAPEDH